MATKYSVDVTNSIEPASADYSALARAAESRAKTTQILAKSAESLVGIYQKTKLYEAEEKASELSAEFLRSNQMALESGRQASQMEAMRPERGGAVAEAMLGAGGAERQIKAREALKGFDREISRLKEASNSGMSNAQYVNRINSLVKEAIAANPAMADEIRQKVGALTGLEGADRWAQMQYVKDRFTKPTTTKDPLSEADMAAATIKRIAPLGTFGDEVTLTNLFRTNRVEYDRRVRAATEYLASKTQTEAIQNQVAGLTASSDLEVDKARAGFVAVFAGGVQSNVLNTTVVDAENTFGQTLELMKRGDPKAIDPVKFKVLVDLHATQMRTNIDAAKRQAYQTIDTYLANNPNISDAKRKELYADIDRSAENLLTRYTDKSGVGLIAMANIMSSYRDKTLTEKQQLVDLAIKQQSAMQNNPMVMAYWAGGSNRENLKRTNRHFYEFMVQQEQNLTTSIMGVRDDIKAAQDLSTVQTVVVTGEQTGTAVPPPVVGDPSAVKAGHEALQSTAVQLLGKADLTQPEINVISSAFATNAQYGANSQLLLSNYKTFGEKLKKLNPVDFGQVKREIDRSVAVGVQSISDIRDVLNTKYKTNYQVKSSPEGVLYLDSIGTAASMRDPKARAIFDEFKKQAKALSITTVFSRAMVTDEDPSVIGKQYADAINGNTPVASFYDTSATSNKPVEPAKPDLKDNKYAGIIEQGLRLKGMMGGATVAPTEATVKEAPETMAKSVPSKPAESKPATQSSEYYMTPDEAFDKFKIPTDVREAFLRGAQRMELDPVKLANQYARLDKKEQDNFIKKLRDAQ